MILGVPACPAHLQSLQSYLYTIKNCHIINSSLPHRHTHPSLPPSRQMGMGPKPKPNTRSATAQAPPDSRKRQGSNADQLKTKRTRRKTNEANEANDDLNKSEDEQEAADGVEDEDEDGVEMLALGLSSRIRLDCEVLKSTI